MNEADEVRLPAHLKAIAWFILAGGVVGVLVAGLGLLGVSGLEHRAQWAPLVLSGYAAWSARDILRGDRRGIDHLLLTYAVLIALLLFFAAREGLQGRWRDAFGDPRLVIGIVATLGFSAYLLWCRARWSELVKSGGGRLPPVTVVSATALSTGPVEVDPDVLAHVIGAITQRDVVVGDAAGAVRFTAGLFECFVRVSPRRSTRAATDVGHLIDTATDDGDELRRGLERFGSSLEIDCHHRGEPGRAARVIQALARRSMHRGSIVIGPDRVAAWRDDLDLAAEGLLVERGRAGP